MKLKRILTQAALLCALPLGANAVIVEGTFSGTVAEYQFDYTQIFGIDAKVGDTVTGSYKYDTELAPAPVLGHNPFDANMISSVNSSDTDIWVELTVTINNRTFVFHDPIHPDSGNDSKNEYVSTYFFPEGGRGNNPSDKERLRISKVVQERPVIDGTVFYNSRRGWVRLESHNLDLINYNSLEQDFEWVATPEDTSTTAGGQFIIDESYLNSDGVIIRGQGVANITLTSFSGHVTGPSPIQNSKPQADAGENQSVELGDTVTLVGTGSDIDGNLLSYNWSLVVPVGSNATLSSTTAVSPTFTVDIPGQYVAHLTVNDGKLDSDISTVTISTINAAPTADAGADIAVNLASTVLLDASGSTDPEGDDLTYLWSFTSKPDGSSAALDDPTKGYPVFTVDTVGEYTLALVVNDGEIDSEPSTITISTNNVAPVANAGDNQSGIVGDVIALSGGLSNDVDNDTLTFKWSLSSVPDGSNTSLTNDTSENASFTADIAGVYALNLVVNDGELDSEPSTISVSIITNETAATTALQDLIDIINEVIDPNVFQNQWQVRALTFRLNMVLASIEREQSWLAVRQLERLLRRSDGCSKNGWPDRNDQVRNCETQALLQSSITGIIEVLDVNDAPIPWWQR